MHLDFVKRFTSETRNLLGIMVNPVTVCLSDNQSLIGTRDHTLAITDFLQFTCMQCGGMIILLYPQSAVYERLEAWYAFQVEIYLAGPPRC